MQLRNRHTKKDVFNTFAQPSLFAQPVEDMETLGEVIREISAKLPKNLDPAHKKLILSQIQLLWKNNYKALQEFSEKLPEFLAQQKSKQLAMQKAKTDEEYGLFNLLKSVGQQLVSAKLGVLGFVGANLMAAAAADPLPPGYTIHEGVPAGASSLCQAVFGCLEGYLQDDNLGNTLQFQRTVTLSPGEDQDLATYETLKKCMTVEGMGEDLINSILGDTSRPGSCPTKSTDWKGYYVGGVATNVPKDSCSAYQNAFGARAISCESTTSRILTKIEIAGIAVGGVAALVCLCCIGIYCCKNRAKDEPLLDASNTV